VGDKAGKKGGEGPFRGGEGIENLTKKEKPTLGEGENLDWGGGGIGVPEVHEKRKLGRPKGL